MNAVDLPGFEKSVPASRPATRSQGPVSAWDVDLSPFHKLVEQQVASTQQLMDLFSRKMEEMITLLREDNLQSDKKLQSFHEKNLQVAKTQAKDNDAIRQGVAEILEKLHGSQQFLQEISERYLKLLDNIQKNSHDLLRPMMSQENLLREGFNPLQILEPLEKLVILEEESCHQIQCLVTAAQQSHAYQEQVSQQNELLLAKLEELERKFDSIEQLLLALGTSIQNHLPDKNFLAEQFAKTIAEQSRMVAELSKIGERLAQPSAPLENFIHNLEKVFTQQQDLLEQKYRHRENLLFWLFAIFSVLVAACIFMLIK